MRCARQKFSQNAALHMKKGVRNSSTMWRLKGTALRKSHEGTIRNLTRHQRVGTLHLLKMPPAIKSPCKRRSFAEVASTRCYVWVCLSNAVSGRVRTEPSVSSTSSALSRVLPTCSQTLLSNFLGTYWSSLIQACVRRLKATTTACHFKGRLSEVLMENAIWNPVREEENLTFLKRLLNFKQKGLN